jgi:hypothetical protein
VTLLSYHQRKLGRPRQLHVAEREQNVIERHVVAVDVGELIAELRIVRMEAVPVSEPLTRNCSELG